jgi:hypothetical protein
MKHINLRIVGLTLAVVLGSSSFAAQEHKAPPKTETANVAETIHGVTITDPYRWLEDQNSPETRAWIKAQNEYTDSMLGGFAGREKIHQRLEQLMKIDVIGAPFERGGRYFIRKRRADQNQFVIYARNGLNGKDEMLIDGNTLSPDQTSSAAIMDVTQNGKYMAYGIRQGGEDEVAVSIMNVDTRKNFPDRLCALLWTFAQATRERFLLHDVCQGRSASLLPCDGNQTGGRPEDLWRRLRTGNNHWLESFRRRALPADCCELRIGGRQERGVGARPRVQRAHHPDC